ncbi:MAG TPA: hypothetical protein VFT78_11940 [Hanamia sp.]|nr:hypothetical protein [Hanamia sp.]HZI68422.1 hypothetical protein [Hanamia sp.]
MAINKNHLFEELDGIKCGIVEKEVSAGRVEFLKNLLEYNGFTVVAIPSPPPKAPAQPVKKEGEESTTEAEEPKLPITFTVGVTDYTFNPINAIFGRLLKTPDGHVVTLAYWEQKENESRDEIPYFEKR